MWYASETSRNFLTKCSVKCSVLVDCSVKIANGLQYWEGEEESSFDPDGIGGTTGSFRRKRLLCRRRLSSSVECGLSNSNSFSYRHDASWRHISGRSADCTLVMCAFVLNIVTKPTIQITQSNWQ